MTKPLGMISTYASGVDVIVEWKIPGFWYLPKEDGAEFSSPDFSFGDHTWYLVIRPNGRGLSYSSGFIDLRLWKHSSDHSIRQEFSLSLKTVKGEKQNEWLKVFERERLYQEFLRFIERSKLSKRQPEFVPEGVLTVICTMKNATSVGSASNTVSDECCHCKDAFDAEILSSHQKKCMHRPVKCPDCLEIVMLQKWLEDHECQNERTEDAESVCEDYKKMLLDGHNHDLILKVGGKEFRVHRDILRARSKVFESMLNHDMKEKNSGIIDVPDCDPNAMELFLSYVYCGKIESLDHSNMLGLYYIADKYEMMVLKRKCCNFIQKSLYLTNICSVIQLALNHSDSDLLDYATGFFADNVLDIMKTVEWQSFLKDNSTVGNELLMKSIEKLKNA